MKYILLILLTITVPPAFAQDPKIGDYLDSTNPSLLILETEIPYHDFNKVSRAQESRGLGDVYKRQETTNKFFEIGMGSHPNNKYWIAAQVPETGYVILYTAHENGWVQSKPTKITYSEQNGLTVDNGLRTVLSNLDLSPFKIKSYSVHGMEGSTDPPAVTAGAYYVKIISADYGENLSLIHI